MEMCSQKCASVGDFPAVNVSVGSVSIPGKGRGKSQHADPHWRPCWKRQGDEQGAGLPWLGFCPSCEPASSARSAGCQEMEGAAHSCLAGR